MGLMDDWTKKKSQQTSSAGKDPWGPATTGLMSGLDAAQNLYNNDAGYNPYPNRTVAKRSANTLGAMGQIQGLAGQPIQGLADANNWAQSQIQNNGMTADTNRVAGQYQDIVNNGGMTDGLRQSASYLDQFANGGYQEDPRLAAAMQARETRAANNAASLASGSGRYGSGAMGQTMGTAMADSSNELMLQSNENARNRQLQASGSLAGLYGSAADRSQSANGAMAGIYSDGLGRAAGAASMLPGLNELRYDGANRMAGLGAQEDAFQQSLLNSKVDKYNQKQARPWEQLQRMWSYPTSAAQLGGTQWSIGQGQETPSMLQNVATVAGTVGKVAGAM